MTSISITHMSREMRHDIAKEIERCFRPLRASRLILTFDNDVLHIMVFPPSEGKFQVPAGPRTLTIRDGLVEE